MTYENSPSSFKINLKRSFQSQIFRTGYIGSIEQGAVTCAASVTGQLGFSDSSRLEACPLPPTIDWMMNSEVRIFVTRPRRALIPPLTVQRVIIHTNPYVLTVVVPFAHQAMTIRIDYLDIELPAGLATDDRRCGEKPLPFLNYQRSEAPYQPASRLPFAFYYNEFVLVAAPRGSVTAFLIDQADRLRAAFRTEVPVPVGGVALHRTSSLTSCAVRLLHIDSGDVFEYRTNARFFVERNPRWIVPLLHEAIRHPQFSLASLLSREVMRVYWNGEVFNEFVLLALNRRGPSQNFAQRVCSTFAKPRFFRQLTELFEEFAPSNSRGLPERSRTVEPLYSFRELESKARHVEWLDVAALFVRVLELLQSRDCDVALFPPEVQYHAWLQITAIRTSIAPPQVALRIDPRFPPDVPARIIRTWSARNMLPLAYGWPAVPLSGLPIDQDSQENQVKARRVWWHLHTKPVQMVRTSGVEPHTKMFEFVEQVTNQIAGAESGPLLFSLHQYLLGIDMTKPISDT
jgi:hypothetical protein